MRHLTVKVLANQRQVVANFLVVQFFLLTLSGCSTVETKNETDATAFRPHMLSSTLYVEKEGKTYKLKSDLALLDENSMRIDVTTTVDLPLASVILNKRKIEYVLYRTKKYYYGKPNPKALDPVFPLSVDAETLFALLNERPAPGAQCLFDNKKITQCSGTSGEYKYQVTWGKRSQAGQWAGRATRIELSIPERKVSLKFYLTGIQKNVSDLDKMSALQVPQGFQTLTVPEN